MVLEDKAVALIGGFTPSLSIPTSSAAERQRVPIVGGFSPIHAFMGGNKAGWTYAWNYFFDDAAQGDEPFLVTEQVDPDTNKKVAIFSTNEDDGLIEQRLWKANAKKHGYEIAYVASFPVGTTDFSSFIPKAKASGADIVVALSEPPGGIALWKQMKAAGLKPKVAFCYKCANNSAWPKTLGPLADGTLAPHFWAPSLDRPGTDDLVADLGDKYPVATDLSTVVNADTNIKVIADAITAAGSTDPEKINEAIGKTDKAYPYMDIKFNDDHVAILPPHYLQWQDGKAVMVYPDDLAEGEFEAPTAGLR
jgi:branched-chain amino acid transport system substrate-binding protein